MKTFHILTLVLAFAPGMLAAPIADSTNEITTEYPGCSADIDAHPSNSTSYPEQILNAASKKKPQTTWIKFCTETGRKGRCVEFDRMNYKCKDLNLSIGSVSSIQMSVMSKCKVYKRLGCQDKFGFKQLEVNKVNALWDWNTEDFGMENQVRSFMCFDYDA